jgi:hypothetical protein
MMRRSSLLAVMGLALTAGACTDIGSSDLLTNGMSAVIIGEADGTGSTEVVTVLRAGGPTSTTFVELEGDDDLTVNVEGETATLTRRTLGSAHSYAASVPVDAPEATFTVALTRTIDAGAPANTFSLPAPFTVDEPAVDRFTSAEDLTITWDAANDFGGEMEVVVDGECIIPWSRELTGDPGSAVIPGGDLSFVGDEPGTSCQVEVEVRRVSGGELDPAFGEGGTVQGVQVRAVTVTFQRADG